VVIEVDVMGVGMLGILTGGEDDMVGVPQIEGPVENGMDDVGPMELRGGNMGIPNMLPRELPPVPLEDGLVRSYKIEETLVLDMVGGALNKENGSLTISFTWTSRGASGSVKGGLKFCGGHSSTTSTSTKPVSSNQR
jgi:hypothetical protein